MLAIYKKEMHSYFTTVTGYIFLAVALIISSFVFSITTIFADTSDLSSYFSMILFLLIIFLPILTMRSFSDERRTKTEQLLLTSPNSIFSLVIGKFLSAFTMYIIYLALSCFNFIVLYLPTFRPETSSAPNTPMIIGNLIALVLVGMCFIAIGIFVSTLTENMFASAVITVGILFGLLIINGVGNLFSADSLYVLRYIIDWLSIFARYDAFVYAYFDISALIYYISITGIFLFLSERVFQARRLS